MKNSKKIICGFILLVLFGSVAFSQESDYLGFNDGRNDCIFIEAGTSSGEGIIINFFGALFGAIFSDENLSNSFPIYLGTGYEHCFFNTLLVGGYTSYEFLISGKGLISTFGTIGAQYGFNRVKFYHKIALGAATADFSTFIFNANLTVFGVKVDIIQGLYGHLDFNIGAKGLLTAGIDYRF